MKPHIRDLLKIDSKLTDWKQPYNQWRVEGRRILEKTILLYHEKIYLPSNESGNGCTDKSECEDGTQIFEKIFLK